MNKFNLNTIELNAILYYADFLSMKSKSIPVTDNCKYFFIYGTPINSLFIADTNPIYDEENPYFQQSKDEYLILKDKFGEEGVLSFVDNICSIAALGVVEGVDMLYCIHRNSTRSVRNKALKKYSEWKDKLTYKHYIKDDEGKSKLAECSKYVAHEEQARGMCIESNVLEISRIH